MQFNCAFQHLKFDNYQHGSENSVSSLMVQLFAGPFFPCHHIQKEVLIVFSKEEFCVACACPVKCLAFFTGAWDI
jgi:hypothetical protein